MLEKRRECWRKERMLNNGENVGERERMLDKGKNI